MHSNYRGENCVACPALSTLSFRLNELMRRHWRAAHKELWQPPSMPAPPADKAPLKRRSLIAALPRVIGVIAALRTGATKSAS